MQMVEDARHSAVIFWHGNHADGPHKMCGRCASQTLWIGLPIAGTCPNIPISPIRLEVWLTSDAKE